MEFRTIPSLNNLYEINEDGTVFRNVKTKKELTIKLDMHHSKTGYFTTFVHIGGRRPDAYYKRVMIHRAVAECWLGQCPKGMEVDHKDRNTHNNHYTNLRYVTKEEQMQNRDHTNISKKGKENLEKARRDRMIPIKIENDNTIKNFESVSSCARFFEEIYNESSERFRGKLRNKVSKIRDYNIIYGA